MGDAVYKQRFANVRKEDESFLVFPATLQNRLLVQSHRLFRGGVRLARRYVKGKERRPSVRHGLKARFSLERGPTMVTHSRRLLTSLVLLAGLPAVVAAQHSMMPIVVQADRIKIGGIDFVPRCVPSERVLIVAVRQTVEAQPDSTWDCVEVAGTLRVSRAHDTVLRFTHLFVLPGGVLDVGTQADPIPADRHVELIVRDVPIDTARDPFQWGNGLVNFGTQTRVGAAKLAWTTLTESVMQGALTVTLAEDPQGWRPGDELLIPDTSLGGRQREQPVSVASMSGRTVTLSKPLDFDHLAQTDPDGGIVLLPRIANLTRNLVVRSENPAGTRGHTADVGHDASWRIAYNELSGLGRSKAESIDDTTADRSHIGTNPKGRYVDHKHHAHGFGSVSVGNVLRGSGQVVGKWGLVVHGTHDALIERNIGIDFSGAAFITEDGYEVRNVFRKNFAAYNLGNSDSLMRTEMNIVQFNNPGSEGNGFWLRGVLGHARR